MNNFLRLRSSIVLVLFSLLWLGSPVVNAQTATALPSPTWCRQFDFTASQAGWSPVVDGGMNTIYVAGVGFRGSGSKADRTSVYKDLGASTFLTTVEVVYEQLASPSVNWLLWDYVGMPDEDDHPANRMTPTTNQTWGGSNRRLVFNQYTSRQKLQYHIQLTGDTTSYRYTIIDIRLYGTGSDPAWSGSTNCMPATPTPTPTLTPTATGTVTGTPPVAENFLCAGSPVDPTTVSMQYQQQCTPCLAAYATLQPFEGDGSPTPTQTPIGYQTPTSVPNIATYVPAATSVATPTPVVNYEICDFSVDCDFVSIIQGHTPDASGIHEVAFLNQLGGYWLGAEIAVILPQSENGLPIVTDIQVDFTISDPNTIEDNVDVKYVTATGLTWQTEHLDYHDGFHSIMIEDVNEDLLQGTSAFVNFLFIVDAAPTSGELEGSLEILAVEISYLGDNVATGDESLTCYLPENYPQPVGFAFTLTTFIQTSCYTIVPFIDMTLLSDVLVSLGFDVENWFIREVEVCVDWYTLPTVTFMNIPVPITAIINLLVLRQIIKWILGF